MSTSENKNSTSSSNQEQQQQERTGRTLAILSMDAPEGWCIYDDLLVEPLAQRGWTVSNSRVNWRKWREIDWSRLFDVVVIRSTWDYQDDLAEFHRALSHIQNHHQISSSSAEKESNSNRKPVMVMNDVELIKWNCRKTYCIDLATKGGAIINPSLFLHDRVCYSHLLPLLPSNDNNHINNNNITTMITRQEFDIIMKKSLDLFPEILAKPICGASSFGIVRITREEFLDDSPFIFVEEPAVVQLRDGKLTYFGEDIEELEGLVKRGEGEEGRKRVEFKSKLDYVWCAVRAGNGDYILQPYLDTITTHGEWSLFFFNPKKISHAMRKIPMTGDFRVQEEYGAVHTRLSVDWKHQQHQQHQQQQNDNDDKNKFDPTKHLDPAAIVAAQKLFSAFPSSSSSSSSSSVINNINWLYARIDLIPIPKEVIRKCREAKWGFCCRDDVDLETISPNSPFVWSTMECELVEPSLYFNVCPEGIVNFCDEFCSRF